MELDPGPALGDELQPPLSVREEGEVPLAVDGEEVLVFLPEVRKTLVVVAGHPARRLAVHGIIVRVDAVFGLQARDGDVELQDADGPEDVVVPPDGAEELHGALFRELL